MANIKQQIADFRQSTPRHIQWLLLVVAFIVVLIFLTLLFTGKKEDTDINEETSAELFFTPEMLDWDNTPTGDTQSADIVLSATAPIKISDITKSADISGFSMTQQCTGLAKIDDVSTCQMHMKYTPTSSAMRKQVKIIVRWKTVNAPAGIDDMVSEFYVTLGATGNAIAETPVKKIESEPTPVSEKESEPIQAPAPIVIPEPEPEPVKPIDEQIQDNIEKIAPSVPVDDIWSGKKDNGDDYVPAPEACSDFAIPGYNSAGRQIGWIKPERGAYYFHPFSDKDCDKPTGIYNPDNGIITDIKDSGKHIGTDAEHIGRGLITTGTLPKLTNPAIRKASANAEYYDATKLVGDAPSLTGLPAGAANGDLSLNRIISKESATPPETYIGSGDNRVISTRAYDRQFILRQYKPIPATIVSDVRADPSLYDNSQSIQLPVRATVDRNVYADDGRNIILPTGTLMLGYVTGTLPGPYTTIGRMQIKWYQFILPNGVEFNFGGGNDPISADSQGRMGVPGRGSTDYLEQFVMPMLTAIVPAAVNMIAPVADKFVNQIDLDNNTVVQSGTMRSSELAKNEIITAWNQVAQKLLVDMMDNTTPPFSIAAGTRITVYSPADLIVSCGEPNGLNAGKKCALGYGNSKRGGPGTPPTPKYEDGSWIGQARSFTMIDWCETKNGAKHAKTDQATLEQIQAKGYSFSTVEMYCQTQNYQAINNAKQTVYFNDQSQQYQNKYQTTSSTSGNALYNQEILGLKYENPDDTNSAILNPFAKPVEEAPAQAEATIGCLDGTAPDANGCCTGEVYTDMGEDGFNCCPEAGGDCFPPIL